MAKEGQVRLDCEQALFEHGLLASVKYS